VKFPTLPALQKTVVPASPGPSSPRTDRLTLRKLKSSAMLL